MPRRLGTKGPNPKSNPAHEPEPQGATPGIKTEPRGATPGIKRARVATYGGAGVNPGWELLDVLGLAVLARPAFPERARRRSPTEHPMALDSVCVCRSPSALRRATGSVGRCHVSTQSRQSFIFCEARARHTPRGVRSAAGRGGGTPSLPPPPCSRAGASVRRAQRDAPSPCSGVAGGAGCWGEEAPARGRAGARATAGPPPFRVRPAADGHCGVRQSAPSDTAE